MAIAASLARVAPCAPSAPGPRARVESLLRARKLDRTLTSTWPVGDSVDRSMPWHVASLDTALHGGLKRGQLSEVAGPVSSGRTSLAWGWLAAATRRGEHAALIDTFDRFDVASGAACGIVLAQLLWVRGQALSKTAGAIDPSWLPGVRAVSGPGTLLERTIDRALKALNLVLQSQVCTAVVLDLAEVPVSALRSIPASTWLRLERIIEGSEIACLLLAPTPTARSAGGITINTGAQGAQGARGARGAQGAPVDAPQAPQAPQAPCTPRWVGAHDRSRRLTGLYVSAHLISPRRSTITQVALTTQMDPAV
jgi:hypothetical protein